MVEAKSNVEQPLALPTRSASKNIGGSSLIESSDPTEAFPRLSENLSDAALSIRPGSVRFNAMNALYFSATDFQSVYESLWNAFCTAVRAICSLRLSSHLT